MKLKLYLYCTINHQKDIIAYNGDVKVATMLQNCIYNKTKLVNQKNIVLYLVVCNKNNYFFPSHCSFKQEFLVQDVAIECMLAV